MPISSKNCLTCLRCSNETEVWDEEKARKRVRLASDQAVFSNAVVRLKRQDTEAPHSNHRLSENRGVGNSHGGDHHA